ncbi:MAG: phosphate ABC transporter permease PstA [Thermoproteota archaeon]
MKEKILFAALGVPVAICLLVFGGILFIMFTGLPTLSWKLLTTGVLQGGIFEMVIGTIYLFLGSAAISGPVGVFAAIYLEKYAPKTKITRVIDQSINNLAGVPSIIIGLFGFVFFSVQLGLNVSLAAGWLTLSLMMLPIVIRGSEEAIRMVPNSFENAAMALGTTKWKAITLTTLHAAAPGIITSVILGIARVAGETAAILLTASVALTRGLPSTPFKPVMALAFDIYIKIVARGEPPEEVFGVALVLFFIVASFALSAMILRTYYRRRQPWIR